MELGVPTTSNTGMLLASFSRSALAGRGAMVDSHKPDVLGSRSEHQEGASEAGALRRRVG